MISSMNNTEKTSLKHPHCVQELAIGRRNSGLLDLIINYYTQVLHSTNNVSKKITIVFYINILGIF